MYGSAALDLGFSGDADGQILVSWVSAHFGNEACWCAGASSTSGEAQVGGGSTEAENTSG